MTREELIQNNLRLVKKLNKETCFSLTMLGQKHLLNDYRKRLYFSERYTEKSGNILRAEGMDSERKISALLDAWRSCRSDYESKDRVDLLDGELVVPRHKVSDFKKHATDESEGVTFDVYIDSEDLPKTGSFLSNKISEAFESITK